MFKPTNSDVLNTALDEAVLGSLSFNGQRCTALKILFVPKDQSASFAELLAERVERLPVGLPWQTWDGDSVSKITPLPNQKRVEYMKELIEDATTKGAKIMNKDGGSVVGGPDSTLMVPAVLYPVTPDMKIYSEEQVCSCLRRLCRLSLGLDLSTHIVYCSVRTYCSYRAV